MVDLGTDVEDPGHDADALGLHSDREAHQVRRGAVRISLERVVLRGPIGLVAGCIGGDPDLDVSAEPQRLALFPRPGPDRAAREDSEFHDCKPPISVARSLRCLWPARTHPGWS